MRQLLTFRFRTFPLRNSSASVMIAVGSDLSLALDLPSSGFLSCTTKQYRYFGGCDCSSCLNTKVYAYGRKRWIY